MAGHSIDTEVISDSECLRVMPSLMELVSKLDSKKTSWSLNNKQGHVTLTISDISYPGHRSRDGNGSHFVRSRDIAQDGVYVSSARYRNSYRDFRNTEPNSKIKRKSPSERNRDNRRLQKFISEKHETASTPDTSHVSHQSPLCPEPLVRGVVQDRAVMTENPGVDRAVMTEECKNPGVNRSVMTEMDMSSSAILSRDEYDQYLVRNTRYDEIIAKYNTVKNELQSEFETFKENYEAKLNRVTSQRDDLLQSCLTLRNDSLVCWNSPDCDKKLLRCSVCGIAKYCTKTCQTKHWKAGHKTQCQDLRIKPVKPDQDPP